MITAQDIREKTFEKSKLGGYDMAEVDEFLEQLADELTSSQKENAVLKSKMKVLVDKIEEYRGNENALNQTLLSAQKLATQIENEAKEKASAMIAEAEKQVSDTIGTIKAEAAIEEKRLNDAKLASAKFFDGIRAMCNAQLKNIDNLDVAREVKKTATVPLSSADEIIQEMKAPENSSENVSAPVKSYNRSYDKQFSQQAADIEEAVRSIEASVAKKQPEPKVRLDFSSDVESSFFSGRADRDSTQPFKI